MSKIFRLHSGAAETVQHWQQMPSHLSTALAETIKDPAGSNANTQITSIPTPFARMDLVRTAFNYVFRKQSLQGNTIFHRIVSNTLDIAEIFYNIEALREKVEIVAWNSGITDTGKDIDIDRKSDLGELLQSSNPKHRLLGETLETFIKQDKKSFNFNSLRNCYVLNYKQGPEIINIIGGTSPITAFFSSANKNTFVDIRFGNHQVFSDRFCPLNERSKDFIQFMFSCQGAFPGFSTRFPTLAEYLKLVFEALDPAFKNEIRNVAEGEQAIAYYEATYQPMAVKEEGNYAEILGFPLRSKKHKNQNTADQNDFIINSSINGKDSIQPCVLPIDEFSETMRYAGGTWQKDNHKKVPYYDERPLQDRTLPNHDHIKYPYLTISDLLEPYLIKVPFPIDTDRFFNGHYTVRSGEEDHGYVLPLKKTYFKYFTLTDLQGTVADGKKSFELVQMPNGVKAVLRIPVKNNQYVVLSRIYDTNVYSDRIQQPAEKENRGIISENQFTLAIYPFVKLPETINPHYRILLVDRDVTPRNKAHRYKVNFFNQHTIDAIPVQASKTRSSKEQAPGVTTTYHVLEQNFDFIEVSLREATGIIIPSFKPLPPPSRQFKFAIDLGTTNTHIEYKDGDRNAVPFDITDNDIQVGTLHSPHEDRIREIFAAKRDPLLLKLIAIREEEFIPFRIGPALQYKFPQRTVISDNGMFNPHEPNFALADFNIPFWYLKEDRRINSTITPNLKWLDFKDKKSERRTRAFMKQLMLMMRNKVLFNGGDLANTEVVWFYPSSMSLHKRNSVQRYWTTYYQRYFPEARKLHKMSESFAPFYYFYHKQMVRPHDRPAVNVDIGGGTTDVVIYQSEDPILLTSFRFAANALFGDGYGSSIALNGFVNGFEEQVKDALVNTDGQALYAVYEHLKNNTTSSVELIEFFFALENNKLIRDKKIPVSFSNMVSEDNEFKIVLIFFYAAIVYHIASLMKVKQLTIPEFITFSGNGSRIINLITANSDTSVLTHYTQLIFGEVYATNNVPPIELKLSENPKEMTCKGGLECTTFDQFDLIEQRIAHVLSGVAADETIPPASLQYSELKEPPVIEGVCAGAARFIDSFFAWNTKLNYYQNFGVSPGKLPAYQEFLKEKLKNDLIDGIQRKLAEVDENVNINIEETLFFYPLTGCVNRLASRIYQDIKK